MRLYEWEVKTLLKEQGIPTPKGEVVYEAGEAEAAAARLGGSVVVKAQVLTGGRMKAGAVDFASTPQEARALAEKLLGLTVNGFPVQGVLVEERLDVVEEIYLGVTYVPAEKLPALIVNRQGGIDVEAAAGAVVETFDPLRPFEDYLARQAVSAAGLRGNQLRGVSRILAQLARLFLARDATLLEVNPLAITASGELVALDGHMDLEDDGLARHSDLVKRFGLEGRGSSGRPPTPLELEAARIDASDHRGVAGRMVEFDGDIGLLIGGGGASLTVFDALLDAGGRPANYCEVGGNPSVRKVAALTKLLLSKPGVTKIAVINNIVNNTRADLMARGVIKGVMEAGRSPKDTIAIFRVPGAWEEESRKILERYGVRYCGRETSIDDAARAVVQGV